MHARRRFALALLALGIAGLHLLVLRTGRAPVGAPPPARAPALNTRAVAAAPPALPAVPRRSRPADAAAHTQDLPPSSGPPATSTAEAGAELPAYPTRPPPAVQWAYRVERAGRTGEAALSWQPDGARYTARLDARIDGEAVLDWHSEGAFDDAGLAPERFVSRRRGRTQAARFDRDAARVEWSGPAAEHALPRGAQDRLSWLPQLSAVVAAAPERVAAGMPVHLFVAGGRGDARPWTFEPAGHEDVTPVGGAAVRALKLVRMPRAPYDARVEVWLDPARHHLPVRLRLGYEGSRAPVIELLHLPSP